MAALAAVPLLGTTVGTVATIAGTAVSAFGAISAGRAQRDAADAQAAQMEMDAKTEFANASMDSAMLKRQTDELKSTARALGAASGVGRDLEIESEIAGFGQTQQDAAIATGLMRRDRLKYGAAAQRASGKPSARAGYIGAAGIAFKGASNSLAAKYGQDGYLGALGTAKQIGPGPNRGYGSF